MHGATDWLCTEGYRVETVAVLDGFVAVVARDDERWLGWGSTPDAAIAQVLDQMFPSGAARTLLERFLDGASERNEQTARLVEERDAVEVPVAPQNEEMFDAPPPDLAQPPSLSDSPPGAICARSSVGSGPRSGSSERKSSAPVV